MSLVSTYVRAKDGNFYRNPVLEDKDWFICFDDDDPVELVIKAKSKLKPKEILSSIGLEYTELQNNGYCGMRIFGKKEKFVDAKSYFFEIKNRIDPKFITKHDGIVKSHVGQGVYYDPKK